MRVLRTLLLCVLVLPLQSCFTFCVWGGELVADENSPSGQESIWSFENADIRWDDVWLRVLLTPVSLTLDAVTMPVQALFWGLDEEDDHTEVDFR